MIWVDTWIKMVWRITGQANGISVDRHHEQGGLIGPMSAL